jgi:predicted RNase H-like HicB family nuclease
MASSGQTLQRTKIRAVLFREGEWWVAQCLEYDIAAQAKSVKDLVYEFQRALVGHIVVSLQEGLKPFATLPKPPKRFLAMFEEGVRLQPEDPPFRMPPKIKLPRPELHLVA